MAGGLTEDRAAVGGRAPGPGAGASARGARLGVVAPLVLALLAFGLRLARLAAPSLRGDEAFAVLFARQGLGPMLDQLRATEPHPPGYYALLHAWMSVAGDSELSVRYLSLVFGVLLVPLTIALARAVAPAGGPPGGPVGEGARPERPDRGGARATALIAALLVAVGPFLVWHSQDARMYALLAATGAASMVWAAVLLRGHRRWPAALAYVACTLLALLAHYAAAFVVLAENVGAALALASMLRAGRPVGGLTRRWAAAQVAVLALAAPWLVGARGILASHASGWIQPVDLPTLLARLLGAYSVGASVDWPLRGIAVAGFALLLALGLAAWARRRGGALVWAYALAPVGSVFVFSLWRPMFDERYLIATAPLLALAVAAGLVALRRLHWLASGLALLLVLGGSAYSLANYLFDPRFAKSPDWRGAGHLILEAGRPGDVLVVNYPDPSLAYYQRGALPTALVPDAAPPDPGRLRGEIDDLLVEYRRVWIAPVRAPNWDADGSAEHWLAARAVVEQEVVLPGLRLERYLSPRALVEAHPPRAVARFGTQIEYLEASVGGPGAPGAVAAVRPGEEFVLWLYFRAAERVSRNWTVYNHVLDVSGRLWGQRDSPPVQGQYPTMAWRDGEVVLDRQVISIAADAPPGRYVVRTGFYDPASGERLAVIGGDGQPLDDGVVSAELAVGLSAPKQAPTASVGLPRQVGHGQRGPL